MRCEDRLLIAFHRWNIAVNKHLGLLLVGVPMALSNKALHAHWHAYFVTLGVPPAVRGRAAGGSFLLKNCCSTAVGRAYGVSSQALLSLLHMFGRAYGLWQQTEM